MCRLRGLPRVLADFSGRLLRLGQELVPLAVEGGGYGGWVIS